MTEQTDTTAGGGSLDWLWLIAALALVVGGLVAYYWLNTQPMWLRAVAVIAGAGLGVGAFALSSWGRAVWKFQKDSQMELRKIVWPTVGETRQTTLIVFVFVVFLGVFFWLIDMALGYATRHLLGTGA